MELKSPVKKRNKGQHHNSPKPPPLPILNNSQIVQTVPVEFNGCFNGTSVVINDPQEISALYKKGFFGKGSMSRSFPKFGKRKKGVPHVISEHQWKRRKEWGKKLSSILQNLPTQYKPMCQMDDFNKPDDDDDDDIKEVEMADSDVCNKDAELQNVPMEVKCDQNDKDKDSLQIDVSQITESELTDKIECKKSEVLSLEDEKSNNSEKDSDIQILEENDVEIIGKECVNQGEADIEIIEDCNKTDLPQNTDICSEETPKTSEDVLDVENDQIKIDEEENPVIETPEIIDVPQTESVCNKVQSESITHEATQILTNREILCSNKVLVIDDSNEDILENLNNLNPHVEEEAVNIVVELLHLSLEEAFFLSFALGCLNVCDLNGQHLSLEDMWLMFTNSQHNFIESYVTYHHFRSKGWVVKSGMKFGGDFLLYKDGPAYYHASYIVVIENINKFDNKDQKKTWADMISLYRMGEASRKEVLICNVLWPSEFKDIKYSLFLKSFTVRETLLRRWLPCHEKDEDA